VLLRGGRCSVLLAVVRGGWRVSGWWSSVRGDASVLGQFLFRGSAQAGEEGNFRDQLHRGNNSWAFFIWKVLRLNPVESWDRAAAHAGRRPSRSGCRAGRAAGVGRSRVVLKQPHLIFRAFAQTPFIKTVLTSVLFFNERVLNPRGFAAEVSFVSQFLHPGNQLLSPIVVRNTYQKKKEETQNLHRRRNTKSLVWREEAYLPGEYDNL